MQKPIWSPAPERIERANLSRFMRFCREESGNADLNSYAPLWQFSVDRPERFWTLVWDFCGIKASGAREPVLPSPDPDGIGGWFPGIRLNVAQNLLRFDDDRAALLHHAPDGSLQRISYSDLRAEVAALAAALREDGVGSGDHVVGALDNTPAALIATLAVASLGAVWSSCAAEVSALELAARFAPLHPKAMFLAAAQAELAASLPETARIVLVPDGNRSAPPTTPGDRMRSLDAFVSAHAAATLAFEPTGFEHPLYVVAGNDPAHAPVHGAGGTLIQHLKELVLHLDLKREDKVLVIADCGSHAWRWAVSCMAIGATLMLQPRPRSEHQVRALWDLIDSCAISVVIGDSDWIVATQALGLQPAASHRLFALKTLACTGGPTPPALVDYVHGAIKDRLLFMPARVADGLIGCFTLGAPLLPVTRDLPQHRALGMGTAVLDAQGQPVVDTPGELACTRPFPSMPIGLLNDPDDRRYHARLLANRGYLSVGQAARISSDGLVQMAAEAAECMAEPEGRETTPRRASQATGHA
jgi:acetoacetyl-CoA synthetase